MLRSAIATLAISLFLCSHRAASDTYTFITSDDVSFGKKASKVANANCPSGSWGSGTATLKGSVDRSTGRATLVDRSYDNLVWRVLTDPKFKSDATGALRNEVNPQQFATRVLSPLIGAIIVLIIWLFCCWTCCPFRFCCRCCRCCVKQRKTSILVKAAGFFLLLLLVVGMIICGAVSYKGYNNISDGLSNTGCVAASLGDTVFNGNVNPYFIGMLTVLSEFQTMVNNLDAKSAFIQNISTIINRTQKITDAVTVATGTLNLMSTTLSLDANVRPADLAGSLFHSCYYCTALGSTLGTASTILSGGIGSALSAARAQVKSQLTGSARQTLQYSLVSASNSLTTMKDSVKSLLQPVVTTSTFFDFTGMVVSSGNGGMPYLLLACTIIIVLALLLALCGLTSCICFCRCETTGTPDGEEKFRKTPHRCACITWTCSFWFIALTLFITAIIMIVMVPVASLCLIVDDFGSASLDQLASQVNLDMKGTAGSTLDNVAQQCLSRAAVTSGTNARLMDMIIVGNNQTLYQTLVTNMKNLIDSAFATVSTTNQTSLMSSTQSLFSAISAASVDTLILPDTSKYSSNADFAAILANPTLRTSFNCSAKCTDAPVGAGLGTFSGTTSPGVQTFYTSLQNLCTGGSGTCAGNNEGLVATTQAVCANGNNYIALKQRLMSPTANIFRCDVFDNGNGGTCDPFNMIQTGTDAGGYKTYSSDCLLANGLMMPMKPVTCNLATFVTYVSNFQQRLTKSFTRVDDAVSGGLGSINADLRGQVNSGILGHIVFIASGLTCTWMGNLLMQMVNGFCYQTVIGFNWVAVSWMVCSAFTGIIIPVMYLQWRTGVDNVNWQNQKVIGMEDNDKIIQ